MKNKLLFKTKENLVRYAIEYFWECQKIPTIKPEQVNPKWHKLGASFVSVYVDDNLRGCIGSHQAYEPLYENIIKNAISAAFSDYRFPPLQKIEINRLKLEISVLSPLKEFKPEDIKHLLQFLKKEKPGLLLEHEGKRALFLPQVWEKLPKPIDFLSHLCQKACLPPDSWKVMKMKYYIFSLV